MTACPVCNKPVDPIRARFVAVRDGKVVPYCSPECRDSQNSKPTVVPAPGTAPAPAPKPIADEESGPVIEILHEPASGVVTSARDERTTQPSGKFEKAEIIEEPEQPRQDGSKSSGGADSAAVAGELPAKSEGKPDAKREAKRARTRPSGKHLTRERKDSTEAKAGWDWLDDEPAEHARAGTVTEGERRARWPWLLLLVLVAGGGGGFYYWKYVANKPATAPVESTASGSAVVVDAATPVTDAGESITKDVAVQRATELLRKYIENDTSVRVQRLAAGALARTGDADAVAALQQGIKQEKNASARFRLAYELARAGVDAGRDVLVAGLAAPERSDKLDAAAKLAQLGDDRGKPLLTSMLAVAQHEKSAAEALVYLKDPTAVKVFEEVLADAQSSVDEKATATIALYRAGRHELADEVKKLLDVETWKAFAAYALGEAGDAAAQPLLVEQLTRGIGVKVRAAYALRPLVGDAPGALLEPLVDQLGSAKDQEQILAAEAILILAGDPQWAKYP